MKQLFSDPEIAEIEEAIRQVELQTSGEVVPYVVRESDPYDEAVWRGAALAAAIAFLANTVTDLLSPSWEPLSAYVTLLLVGVAALLGMLLAWIVPVVRRLLAGSSLLKRRVQQRAREAFIEEEIFATRDRTGILMFISLFEHRVTIMADSGIHAAVPDNAWDQIVDILVDAMRKKTPTAGMLEAIKRCGELLGQHGFARRPDDTNEIANTLRLGSSPKP